MGLRVTVCVLSVTRILGPTKSNINLKKQQGYGYILSTTHWRTSCSRAASKARTQVLLTVTLSQKDIKVPLGTVKASSHSPSFQWKNSLTETSYGWSALSTSSMLQSVLQ